MTDDNEADFARCNDQDGELNAAGNDDNFHYTQSYRQQEVYYEEGGGINILPIIAISLLCVALVLGVFSYARGPSEDLVP